MKSIKSMGTLRECIIEMVKHPKEADAYLNAALDEYAEFRDLEALLLALRTITIAQGGIGFLAKKAGVNRQNLYKILSGKRSPQWKTMEALFKGLGYKISLTRIHTNTNTN